ncbi:hypothetical protein [Bradyrhizobium daqingense]|nr:hypothetical protein [Bradyrhizobium daqingense]
MTPSYRARPGPASRQVPGRLFRKSMSESPELFRPPSSHETKRTANETISRIGEDIRKLAMVTNPANEGRAAHWA